MMGGSVRWSCALLIGCPEHRSRFTAFFLLASITLFFQTPSTGHAQDSTAVPLADTEIVDSLWTIDSVIVRGNEHTKDYVVRREMSLQPGSPITKRMLAYDQNRIYSLRLFNQVQMKVLPTTPGYATLLVEVSERWYIFPFPILGLRDRDWKKVFFGGGILHSNFLGRNEKLYAYIVFGYDPALSLSYRNPFLDADGTEFLEANLTLNIVQNKSIIAEEGGSNYDERHASGYVTFGKRFGIANTIWMSLGYQFIEVSSNLPGRTISPDGTDRFPTATFGYAYDTRDLGEYPSSGTYLAATITKYGIYTDKLDFGRYAFDFQEYIPLPATFVLAGRTYGDIAAGGIVPPYNHDYFGYGNRIRGHFKEVYEGEQLVGATVELHLPLFGPNYYRIESLPAQFNRWRFGVVAALFGDAGTVWFRPAPFALNQLIKGYGAGLHFLLPYSFILRTEYGLNESRRGEFILDVGNSL